MKLMTKRVVPVLPVSRLCLVTCLVSQGPSLGLASIPSHNLHPYPNPNPSPSPNTNHTRCKDHTPYGLVL